MSDRDVAAFGLELEVAVAAGPVDVEAAVDVAAGAVPLGLMTLSRIWIRPLFVLRVLAAV